MNKDIILFGIQGSGKGTQAARLLSEFSSFKHLEPGQVFRAITSNDNIISEHIKDRMRQGKMLDDNLIFDLFNMYYHLLDHDTVMLTDGFPRTIPQMYYFLSKECKHKREYLGIYFEIPREKAVERILKRAREQNREDDLDMKTINQRLDLFEQETLPVIKYFKSIGKLIIIDAQQSVEEIYQQLLNAIKQEG